MSEIKHAPPEDHAQPILALLREAEARVRALEKAVEGKAECSEVLERLADVRAALDRAALAILDRHLEACLSDPARLEPKKLLHILDLFLRLAPARAGKAPR
jgi:DNA-binding FrmR family transcriptional regulator